MLASAVALWAALLWCCGAAALPPHPPSHSPCRTPSPDLLALARQAPAVLEARVRSLARISLDRRANFSVTFIIKRVLKSDPSVGLPLKRGDDVRVPVTHVGCGGPLKIGRSYVLLGKQAPSPPRLRLLTPPHPRSRHLTQRLKEALRPRSGRPPGVVGLQAKSAAEGEVVRLTCQARGRPPPALAWYRNGLPIPPQHLTPNPHKRIRLQTKKRRSMLVISRALLEDSGVYECRAVAEGASPSFSRATLSVQRKITTDSSKQRKLTTDSVNSGAPCPMPDPSSFCLNGGTCLFFEAVREPACKCPEGFKGQRCENKDVNGSSMYHSFECTLGAHTSYYC